MKVYTVRYAMTNTVHATDKGMPFRSYATYEEASSESNRLYNEDGIETYITTDNH